MSGPSGFFYEQIPTLGSLKTNILGLGGGRIISGTRGASRKSLDTHNPSLPTPDLDETEERDTALAFLP